jgi:hypothetical protein
VESCTDELANNEFFTILRARRAGIAEGLKAWSFRGASVATNYSSQGHFPIFANACASRPENMI